MTIKIAQISGFPENLPEEQIVEDRFKEIIKKNYLRAWFNSIETPVVEREEVLCSKWANDNEIYGIHRLNGEKWDDSSLWLRFDLTVPLARYVALYNDKLVYPFKRFQIQKVYRWERAQKWRYREFYQADIDIIWNWELPLMADVEVISTIYNALNELEIGKFTININHKEFLIWYLNYLWVTDEKLLDIIAVIDKKDKVDTDKQNFPKTKLSLKSELNDEDLSDKIIQFIKLWNNGDYEEIEKYVWTEADKQYLTWLMKIKIIYYSLLELWVPKSYIKVNPSISRGLNYYTWVVFETFAQWLENMGSIASGWRYDNLTWNFIKNKYPWTGWSIWLSRLIAVLSENWKLELKRKTLTDVLVLNLDEKYLTKQLKIVSDLRKASINTEFYLEVSKIAKQIKYAENKWIKLVIILWEDEVNKWVVSVKDLDKREQFEIKNDDLIKEITNLIR